MSTSKWYASGVQAFLTKQLDWSADDIYVALLNNTYVPDIDTHAVWDDVSAYEITGTNYTAGGQLLVNCAQTYSTSTNTWILDCDDPLWTNATFTAQRYAVFYKGTSEELIAYIDFGSSNSVNAQNAWLNISVNGVAALVMV